MSLLKIKDIYASIGEEKILNGLSLEINAGETHAIMDQMVLESQLFHMFCQVARIMMLVRAVYF